MKRIGWLVALALTVSMGCKFFRKGALVSQPPAPGQPAASPVVDQTPPEDFLNLEYTEGGARNYSSCFRLKDLMRYHQHRSRAFPSRMHWEKVRDGVWYFHLAYLESDGSPRHAIKTLFVQQNGRVHPAGGTFHASPKHNPHIQGVTNPESQAEQFAKLTKELRSSGIEPPIKPLLECVVVPVTLAVPPEGFIPGPTVAPTPTTPLITGLGPEALAKRKAHSAAAGGWQKLDAEYIKAAGRICSGFKDGMPDAQAIGSCVKELAASSGDAQLCQLLSPTPWQLDDCVIQAMEALGKGGFDCFAFKDDHVIRRCLNARIATGDKQACEELMLLTGNDEATKMCRQYMAPATVEACENLPKTSGACIEQIGFRFRDARICDRQKDGPYAKPKADCYYRMAILKRDLRLCQDAHKECEAKVSFLTGKTPPLYFLGGKAGEDCAPDDKGCEMRWLAWVKPFEPCSKLAAGEAAQCEVIRQYWDRLHGGAEIQPGGTAPARAAPPPPPVTNFITFDVQLKELAESPKGVGNDGTVEMADGRVFFLSRPPDDRRTSRVFDTFAAVFDSEANKWIKSERFNAGMKPSVTDLGNGKILVIGGMDLREQSVAHGVLVDGGLKKVDVAPPLPEAVRSGMIVTLQPGQALLVGGAKGGVRHADNPASNSAFLFKDGKWTAVKPMSQARYRGVAVKLKDGRVLVAGGHEREYDYSGSALSTAEIFDPKTGEWTSIPKMIRKRIGATALRLDDGRVLVAGGDAGSEIYDPAKNDWIEGPVPLETRSSGFLIPLEDGKVAAMGGDQIKGLIEIMDPIKRLSVYSGNINEYYVKDGRRMHLTGAVPDPLGRVIIALSDPRNDVMRPYLFFPRK